VRRGETLSSIARRHGVSVDELRASNGINGSRIVPGQTLLIPVRGETVAAASATPANEIVAGLPPAADTSTVERTHTVRSGDTLWGIAREHGVSVPELAAANGITTQTRLALGTRLTIPGATPTYTRVASADLPTRMTYKVRRGDTLSQIARKFAVSIRELMTWNQLRAASDLRAGQRLVIYVDSPLVSGG
jgi:membrane-bound lytic murein transglycosylase D